MRGKGLLTSPRLCEYVWGSVPLSVSRLEDGNETDKEKDITGKRVGVNLL